VRDLPEASLKAVLAFIQEERGKLRL